MFEAIPQQYLQLVGAAFVLGWLVAKIGSMLSGRVKNSQRDPRDDRIRSLEAEQRIAASEADRAKADAEEARKELSETQTLVADHEKALQESAVQICKLRGDLKESVRLTTELRGELTDRATENLKSEVKLREVETELEVTRASSDMIATGVLDYSIAPENDDVEEEQEQEESPATAR